MQYTSLVSIALDCQCLSNLNVQLNTSYKIKLKSVFPNLLVRNLLVSILSCSGVSWWQHGVSDLSVLPPHISEGRIILCIWQKPRLFIFSKKSRKYTFLLLGVASKSSIFCSSSSHENYQGFLSPLSIDKSPSLSIRTYRAIFHMLSKTNMAVFAIPYLSTTESIGNVNFAHTYT